MEHCLKTIAGVLLVAAGLAHAAPPLGAFGARLDLTTVSGLSAGGAMAEQFGIAHSSIVIGLGLVAAPPYFCAGFLNGRRSATTLFNALEACMNPARAHAAPPDAALLWREVREQAARGAIDDVAYLRRQRVYAFTGAGDEYVTRVVMDQTVRLHQMAGVAQEALVYVTAVRAGHGFIVDDRRALPCDASRVPFVNDCAMPLAWLMLRHLYAQAAPLTEPPSGRLSARVRAFDQRAFAGPLAGLADTGYVYVPAGCARGGCKVHVAFHGCRQSAATVGKAFVEGAGYAAAADRNRMIVLYPQARPGALPFDPFACWDFWGYAGSGFHTRAGAQIRAVRAMLAHLAQPAGVRLPR